MMDTLVGLGEEYFGAGFVYDLFEMLNTILKP